MFGKTPITTLQEYCAKKCFALPIYKCSQTEDGSKTFMCTVEAIDEMAEGIGRSKKEAKHDAAAHIIKKLKISHPDIEKIPQAPHETVPTSDAVADLRDICIQQDHPLPSFEMIQQAGPSEAPEFTYQCRVASVIRHATFSTKKGAKQLAAQMLIDIIQEIPLEQNQMQIARLSDTIEAQEKINQKKIQTYRELIDSGIKEMPGTLLKERHKCLEKIDAELKAKARSVMKDPYYSDMEKVVLMFKELDIKYKTQSIPSAGWGSLTFIELLCDIDIVFAGLQNEIYPRILSFLENML